MSERIIDDAFTFGLNLIDMEAYKGAVNIQRHNKEKANKEFEKSWKSLGATSYNPRNYKRFAFRYNPKLGEKARKEAKARADQFAADMATQGIPVAVVFDEANCQYLFEIPETATVKGVNQTAEEIIEDYRNRTGEDVEYEREEIEIKQTTGSATDNISPVNRLASNMDALGSFIYFASEADAAVVGNSVASDGEILASQNREPALFSASGKAVPIAPRDKAMIENGKATTAYVLDNGTVIINGKVSTDAALNAEVTKRYNNIKSKAQKIVDSDAKASPVKKALISKRQQQIVDNAKLIADANYGTVVVTNKKYVAGRRKTVAEQSAEEINTGIAFVKSMEATFTVSTKDITSINNAIRTSGKALSPEQNRVITKFTSGRALLSAKERIILSDTLNTLGLSNIVKDYDIALSSNQKDIFDAVESELMVYKQAGVVAEQFVFSNNETDVFSKIFKSDVKLTGDEKKAIKEVFSGKGRLTTAERKSVTNALGKYRSELTTKISNIHAELANPAISASERAKLTTELKNLNDELATVSDIETKVNVTGTATGIGTTGYEAKFDIDEIINNKGIVNAIDLEKWNGEMLKAIAGAGVEIYDKKGKFNPDALRDMPVGLRESLNLSDKQIEKLIELNTTKIVNPALDSLKDAAGFVASIANNIDPEAAQELRGINTARQVYSQSSKLLSAIEKYKGTKRGTVKKTKPSTGTGTGTGTVPPKTPTSTPSNKQINKQLKKIEKNAQKRVAAQTALQKSSLVKMIKAGNAVKNKFATMISKTIVGTASTAIKAAAAGAVAAALPVIGVVLVVIIAIIIIIIVVFLVIQSFTAIGDSIGNTIDNLYAAKSAEDTVAFQLYGTLKQQERDWIEKDLENFDNLYNKKEETKFGDKYTPYETYIGTFPDLKFNSTDFGGDGGLYITPFASETYNVNANTDNTLPLHNPLDDSIKGYMNKTNKFDGSNTVSIVSNSNVLGKATDIPDTEDMETDSSIYDGHGSYLDYSPPNNGHTSNIKDIIAMSDVMYGLDLESGDDSGFEGLLGMTPAQIAWESSPLYSGLKWIQGCFGGREETDIQRQQGVEDAKNYKALQSYAFNLFEASHQQALKLKTEFHTNMDECVNKTTTKFPIYWDGTTITPYLEDSDNNKIPLYNGKESYEFTENVSMANCTEDSGSWCLDDGQGNNWGTWSKLTGNACWSADKPTYELDESSKVSFKVGEFNTYQGGDGTYQYPDGTYNNAWKFYFPSTWRLDWAQGLAGTNENYNADTTAVNYILDRLRKLVGEQSTEVKATRYELSEDRNTFTVYEYLNNFSSLPVDDNSCDTARLTTFFQECINGEIPNNSDYAAQRNNCKFLSFWDAGVNEVPFTSVYMAEYCKYTIKKTVYHRDCKGHDFEYCGGHIAAHSQGIVYSATNEQLAMAGVTDSYRNPVATDEEWLAATADTGIQKTMEDWGYDSIRGKIALSGDKALNKTSNYDATISGKVPSPTKDIQGSYITSHYGLNLFLDAENENKWIEGFSANRLTNYFLRDIFDIDMWVEKGSNVFPPFVTEIADSNYEGWTDDAMTLALCRIGADWNDLYGFEIPYEISDENTPAFPLSNQNIQDIIDGVKETYTLSEEQENKIHLALSWVGMGNYSNIHKHDFLSVCGSHEVRTNVVESGICFDVNCTSSDDLGFVNFILKRTDGGRLNDRDAGSWTSRNFASLSPGDIVKYERKDEAGNSTYHFGVYIGYLSESPVELQYADVGIESKKTKYTNESDEQVETNVPIIVDMDTNGEYGTIYLRGTTNNILKDDSGNNVDTFEKLN